MYLKFSMKTVKVENVWYNFFLRETSVARPWFAKETSACQISFQLLFHLKLMRRPLAQFKLFLFFFLLFRLLFEIAYLSDYQDLEDTGNISFTSLF